MDVIETWDLNLEYTNTLFKTFKIDKTKFNSIKDLKVSVISKKKGKKNHLLTQISIITMFQQENIIF